MEVKEAENGDRILQGRILVAPRDYHLRVKRFGGIYKVICLKDKRWSRRNVKYEKSRSL